MKHEQLDDTSHRVVNGTFEEWKERLDKYLNEEMGITTDNFPDLDYRRYYNQEVRFERIVDKIKSLRAK